MKTLEHHRIIASAWSHCTDLEFRRGNRRLFWGSDCSPALPSPSRFVLHAESENRDGVTVHSHKGQRVRWCVRDCTSSEEGASDPVCAFLDFFDEASTKSRITDSVDPLIDAPENPSKLVATLSFDALLTCQKRRRRRKSPVQSVTP